MFLKACRPLIMKAIYAPRNRRQKQMNIKRYLYLEQDSEREVTAKSFVSRQDAEKYASHRLHETIYDMLGPNYQIPPTYR